jgi:sugar phosphate isomerase/epimerase
MKLGLMSAALPALTLPELVTWSAANGFEMLELACWPIGKSDRRYSGVTHIDVASLTPAQASAIKERFAGAGLGISSLAYYPNPLHPDPEHRAAVHDHLRKVILAAEMLDVPIVGTFAGRDKNKNLGENLGIFAETWPPLVRFAADHGVKIAIENCPMLFSHDEWPGGDNLAINPFAWRKMFEIIPDDNFGLNLDPSHLLWQFIDTERVVHEFRHRIFHVHAKDLRIDKDGLYENGVLSAGMGWQIPRLPGLGQVNWSAFISALYEVGYDYVLSIEHEDRAFEGSEELVKRGFLIARDVLKPYLH